MATSDSQTKFIYEKIDNSSTSQTYHLYATNIHYITLHGLKTYELFLISYLSSCTS